MESDPFRASGHGKEPIMVLAPLQDGHHKDADLMMKDSPTMDTVESPPLIGLTDSLCPSPAGQIKGIEVDVPQPALELEESQSAPSEPSPRSRSTRSARSQSPKSNRSGRRGYRNRSLTKFEVRLAMLRHYIGELLNSQKFDSFLGLIIIANAVNIGLDLTWRAEGKDTTICGTLEHVFLAVYVVELLMRLFVDCRRAVSDNWVRFDTFLVVVGVLSQWILEPFFSDVSEVNTLILLRMARLLRLAKTVRYLMRFRELWLLVVGLANSAYTMIYTILLLVVILYIFACLILQLLYQHPMIQEDEEFARVVKENFRASAKKRIYRSKSYLESNLPAAMVTLLQFVSFDNIVYVYKPLADRDGVLLLYFVLVILVVGIVIMNLVTAVIVNSSLEQAAKDKSLLHAIEEQNRKKVLAELRSMFFRLDHDNSGEVSRDEIAAIAPREQKMLRDLTGFDNAVELFDALDLQESGEIGRSIRVGQLSTTKQVEHIKHHVAKYMAETDKMKSLLHELVSGMQRMESGVNSMSSAAWVAGAPSDQRHSFIAAPQFFAPFDTGITSGQRPGWGEETAESGRETNKDSTENGGSSAPLFTTPQPRSGCPWLGESGASITAKATELARKLVPDTWGRGGLPQHEPAPAWADELIRDVRSLRSITQSFVCSSLAELQARLATPGHPRAPAGISSSAGDPYYMDNPANSPQDHFHINGLGVAPPELSCRSAAKAVRGLIAASRPKATLATTHQAMPMLQPPQVFDDPDKTGASRSNWEDWMVNLRGEDVWLAGPRDLSWYTGQPPLPGLCPGVSPDGAIRALPMPTLNKVTRKQVQEYFDNS
eukprot:s5027_g6.t1